MHEMSLIGSVLGILEDQARRQDFRAVRVVRLEVGALSHAQPEALAFCFEAARPGTLAAEARLEILPVPGRAWCLNCRDTVTIAQRGDPCPVCGDWKLTVTGGEELRIKDLEVV